MKKTTLIVALVIIGVAAFGWVSYANAQSPTPPAPQAPFGQGPGSGMMNPGRMGSGMRGMMQPGRFGPMHEYMQAALAEAMGMSEADLQAAFAEGKTMWQVAQDKGLSAEEFQKVMVEARKTAIAKMVEAGIITQVQADWMLSRMEYRQQQGGFGNCQGMGRGRWGGQGFPPAVNPPSSGF